MNSFTQPYKMTNYIINIANIERCFTFFTILVEKLKISKILLEKINTF